MASRSFKVGTEVPESVRAAALAEGYGVRGISIWVSEAIVDFVAERGANFWDVGTGDKVDGFERVYKVQLTDPAEEALDQAIAAIRSLTPAEEGVRSAVFRTAVRQRLMRTATAALSAPPTERRPARRRRAPAKAE